MEKAVNQPLPVTQAEASAYVGTYENERVMTLSIKDGRLFIRDDTPPGRVGFLGGRAELPVTKVGAHYFIATPLAMRHHSRSDLSMVKAARPSSYISAPEH